jgi:anthranilate 3-monooxygenase (FAD) / 4-hydroxyphenylacetate 3-monooxygenase
MGARTGAQYVERLKNSSREVWLRGTRVTDVTTHAAFNAPMGHIARIYDMQHEPEFKDVLTYDSPSSGDPVGTSFMMAKNYDDIVKRRRAFRLMSDATFGLIGRTPDFCNTIAMAWAESPGVFEKLGPRYKENVLRYYEYVRENDLYLTHAVIPPQVDRSKSSAEQTDKYIHLGVVRETDEGLIVRGARMMVTMAPIADEILIFNLPGIKEGDEAYAMSFAMPLDTQGIKMICREPFDEGRQSPFNHPLASNFEEPDVLLIFDNVLVPWDRVFLHNNIELANALYVQTDMRNHTAHQTAVRALSKLELMVGTAMKVAQTIKVDGFLHIQQMLGEVIGTLEIAKSCIIRAEVEYETTSMGSVRASLTPLTTMRGYLPRAYPRIVEVLQLISAGGILSTPAAEDFTSEIGADIERFFGAAGGSSVDRVKLFKLVWDLTGDAFGSRHLQYERFWAGDPVRLLAGNYLGYEFKSDCLASVDRALELSKGPQQITEEFYIDGV